MDERFPVLLGVWVMLVLAFVVVDERAARRLRSHRVRRLAVPSLHPAPRALAWRTRAYDLESYDDEGKRLLRQLRMRVAALFATWVAAGVIFELLSG